MKNEKNIGKVYKNGLCCSCGICAGICPVKAISYEYDNEGFVVPHISDSCLNCGICEKCCPGKRYYLQENDKKEKYYTLYSNDNVVRRDGSSGGFVTELLCYLLKNDYVDYCVVIPTVKNSLLITPIITNNCSKVKMAAGSKYIMVEYGEILDKIKKSEKRYAMVALPCQEYAIKKYLGEASDRVIIVTLMCNHISGKTATKYLLKKNQTEDNYEIKYRGDGWPGKMSINGENIGTFRDIYTEEFGRYFFNYRCKLCDNHFGKDSIITVGDPYYLSGETTGCSFCIVRDNSIDVIIQDMLENKVIGQKNIEIDENILKTAYKGIFVSESNISIIKKIRRLLFQKNPEGMPRVKNEKIGFNNIIIILLMYYNKFRSKSMSKKINS